MAKAKKDKRKNNDLVATTFYSNWKGMDSWVGTKVLVFCNGLNAPMLFRNLENRSLTWEECDILQTRYPL